MLNVTAPTAPAQPVAAQGRRTSAVPALCAVALLLLLVVGSVLSLSTPSPVPASAPPTAFSAERAVAHLDGIATEPHPAGSPAQARVREYLVDTLEGLGLDAQVQTRVAGKTADNIVDIGTVSNVYATIPGQDPTGRVLLVSHYDSVPIGPGAADNGANVAALLEVARTLLAGPRPRNDVTVLFTDAEEIGLLGANAFVDAGLAGDPSRAVALNLEARGVSGPAVMYEVAGSGLAPAVRASDAITTSVAMLIYRLMPHDSDLSIMRMSGMRGLNFAFLGDSGHYHTPHDTIDRVSQGSVQDMGEAALAATRQLAAEDLGAPRPAGPGQDVYFTVLGGFVSYPGWLALPLVGLALFGYVALLWWGRRHDLSPRRAARAAAGLGLCVLAVSAVGWAGWSALVAARPSTKLLIGGVYNPSWYLYGLTALLLAALLVWLRWARRRASAVEVSVGVLGWFVLLAVATAVLAPSASYLFTWPELVGVAATAAVLRFTPPDSPWRVAAVAASAAVGVLLALPLVVMMVAPLGVVILSEVRLVIAVVLGAAMLAVVDPLPPRRVLTAGMLALAVAGVAGIAVVTAVDGYSPQRPRPVSLSYVMETDAGKAMWISRAGPEQPIVGHLLTDGPVDIDQRVPHLAGPNHLGGPTLTSGPAPVAATLPGSHAEVSPAQVSDGLRTMRVRITAPPQVYSLVIFADTSKHVIVEANVDGVPLLTGQNLSERSAPWRWGFGYTAPPPQGIDLMIRARGDGPMRLMVTTTTGSLPAGVGAPDLPPDASWASWPSVAGQTFVVSTYQL